MAATDAGIVGSAATAQSAAPRIAFRPHPQLPWLLAPQGIPLQVLIDAAPVRVPNTRPWFRGVVSQRGNLLPVFDLAGWSGLDDDDAKTHTVSVGVGAQACAILCASAPTLLLTGARTSAVDGESTALGPYLGESYVSAQGIAREFDLAGWLAAAAQDISGGASG